MGELEKLVLKLHSDSKLILSNSTFHSNVLQAGEVERLVFKLHLSRLITSHHLILAFLSQ